MYLVEFLLPVLVVISPKMKLFVLGRRKTKEEWEVFDFSTATWQWFHCASLGEFEQALPLIKALKKQTADKIIVSFFSPSGYEQKKNHSLVDKAIYLPIDTPKNARKIVKQIKPKAVFVIKYEIWRNYFEVLHNFKIPIYLVSSAFRGNQIYFKWYGVFFKETLGCVTHFFVQNEFSKEVLNSNGFLNVSVSGDTRFDRVNSQLNMNNQLDFMDLFKQDRLCVVLGSTWGECEDVFLDAIKESQDNVCFVIAPHEIKEDRIDELRRKITVKTSVFSEEVDFDSKVLIVNTIGYLTRIYSYADIAYVGGAIGTTGLHNILEPAVFGVPILVGSNTQKFPEAKALEKMGGLQFVTDSESFKKTLLKLVEDEDLRLEKANNAACFVQDQTGATIHVLNYYLANTN